MSSPVLARRAVASIALSALLVAACGSDDPDDAAVDDGASVAFSEPSEGASVAGGVELAMSADGITIEEAGEVRDGAGHFHVIADDGCVAPGTAIGRDADHVHLGAGQSEGTIFLEPGARELCLQVADGAHVALGVTDEMTVDVGVSDRDQWCAVINEVDELFTETDTGGDEFAVRQVGYENIRRLIAQALDAIDQVDADVRGDVAQALEGAAALAGAFVDAADEDAAVAAVEEIFGVAGVPTIGEAAPWISDNCGVDING